MASLFGIKWKNISQGWLLSGNWSTYFCLLWRFCQVPPSSDLFFGIVIGQHRATLQLFLELSWLAVTQPDESDTSSPHVQELAMFRTSSLPPWLSISFWQAALCFISMRSISCRYLPTLSFQIYCRWNKPRIYPTVDWQYLQHVPWSYLSQFLNSF